MSMINAYMVDAVTIIRWEGYDSWGEPESASTVEVKGYVDFRTSLVRDQKGEERVSSVTVLLPRKIERATLLGRKLSLEDRLQIDGESFDRAIIEIRKPKDFSHPHYEIALA